MFDTLRFYDRLSAGFAQTLSDNVAHRIKTESGQTIPWIDENLHPQTGDWISRTRLKTWENGTWSQGKGGVERGKDYNHSTFCDLVINGLIGFKPLENGAFRLFPLVPKDIEYFCLENIRYHGCLVSILYDKTGQRYGQGKGLRIYVDGKTVLTSDVLPMVPILVDMN